jgi:hypothetical protein
MDDDPDYDDIMNVLDINNIHGTLWQGAIPPAGSLLRDKGFDVVVLAASDHQDASWYPGLHVILAPGDDDERPHRLMNFLPTWQAAAREVASHVRSGKKVLVTCMSGYNRSGIVTAMALHELTGWNGHVCVETIKRRRQYALSNKTFVAWVHDNLK